MYSLYNTPLEINESWYFLFKSKLTFYEKNIMWTYLLLIGYIISLVSSLYT